MKPQTRKRLERTGHIVENSIEVVVAILTHEAVAKTTSNNEGLAWSAAVAVLIALNLFAYLVGQGIESSSFRWRWLNRQLLGHEPITGTWVDRVTHPDGTVDFGYFKLEEAGSRLRASSGLDIDSKQQKYEFDFSRSLVDHPVAIYEFEYDVPEGERAKGLGRLSFSKDGLRATASGRFANLSAMSQTQAFSLTPEETNQLRNLTDPLAQTRYIKQVIRDTGMRLWTPIAWSGREADTFTDYRTIVDESPKLNRAVLAILADHFKNRKSVNVLDYGGGPGLLWAEGKGLIDAIVSMEPTDAEGQYLVNASDGTPAQTIAGPPFLGAPFKRWQPFDVFLFSHVLAYIPDPLGLFRQIESGNIGRRDSLWMVILPGIQSVQNRLCKAAKEHGIDLEEGRAYGDYPAILIDMLKRNGKSPKSKVIDFIAEVTEAELKTVIEFWFGKNLSQGVPTGLTQDVPKRGDAYQLHIFDEILYW